ncbi:MAG: class I mannose-6-phosphate isomerase, partial [Deltaproteobacteria bacterium]|nr:class I mannose-6-phosphate isomerase [Deltaproteobacteria bacterium]
AVRLEGSGPGKTEAWYILEADAGARLVLGLKAGVDRTGLSEALEKGQVESVLRGVEVHASEAYYVHAGLLHAIGPGVTLFEIQQNVDLTYRFYDWGRVDDQERPRELHVSKAMEALDASPGEVEPFYGLSYKKEGMRITALAAGRYFALERWEIENEWDGHMSGSRFEVLTVMAGVGRLEAAGSEEVVELTQGQTILLPAALGDYRILESSGLILLRSFVPDLEADVFRPLKGLGFSPGEIQKLAGRRRPNDLSVFS